MLFSEAVGGTWAIERGETHAQDNWKGRRPSGWNRGDPVMTKVLQGAFLVAGLLTLTVVFIGARQLIGAAHGRPHREFPTHRIVEGALLFAGSMYAMATLAGRLGERIGDIDTLLYTAVFGFAAGALAYLGQTSEGQTPDDRTPVGQHRRPLSRVLHFLALALPIGSGLIAGLVGPV